MISEEYSFTPKARYHIYTSPHPVEVRLQLRFRCTCGAVEFYLEDGVFGRLGDQVYRCTVCGKLWGSLTCTLQQVSP